MSNKDIAIKVQDVAKVYRIGTKANKSDSLARSAVNFIKSPLENFRKYRSLYEFDDIETIEDTESCLWALKGVSFEVKQGEVVGIIGRNGAGKSTLLKVLSKITTPTRGSLELRGRISSLLEVGTGFHQELTGRENVYLNGTVLGMRKKEVDRKFDEIVEFSGVEKFLDTPVKRYSSGMRIRLAFAVAAHLEPEILIVDEVLAVGDAAFQKKCMDKMEDVGSEGRTVLFVSHNMSAITRMCQRVILLNQGVVEMDGPAYEIVSAYLEKGHGSNSSVTWDSVADAPGTDIVKVREVRLCLSDGRLSDAIDIREPIHVEIEFEVSTPGHVLQPHVSFMNEEGIVVFASVDLDPQWRKRPRPAGRYVSRVTVPANFFAEGPAVIDISMWALEPRQELQFHVRDALAFQVIDSLDGDSTRGDWPGNYVGVVRPMLEWNTEFQAS
ncbi:MAG: ABC transporter ATP-binding protein [Gammaproteobacteria bacterium]|nr:ABC transporter ATP-binding protein [Gammaproteobacteria bacterium]